MYVDGTYLDHELLFSRQEVIALLEDNGSTDASLSSIRDTYMGKFGNELVWHIPLSLDVSEGMVIVAVREGFLSLPYNACDEVEYEIFELHLASILSFEEVMYIMQEWKKRSKYIMGVLRDIRRYERILEER